MYLRQGEDLSKIKEELKQVFDHDFVLNVGQREIIKMRNANVITDRDLSISKFLFKFKFATAKQIQRYLKIVKDNENSLAGLVIRLDKLVNYRVLNKFMLTNDITHTKIQEDAEEIYCLDLGGRYLLANYSNEDTSEWYSIVNMKTSEIISKSLATTDFYLSVMEVIPEKVHYFNPEPDIKSGRKIINPSFDMCIEANGNKSYFVGEVVREFDFPIHFREKAMKLEVLLEGNAWKKYYYDSISPPVLFLLADSDRTALEISMLVTEVTEMRRFRLTTDKRIREPLYEEGAFLKFNERDKTFFIWTPLFFDKCSVFRKMCES